jgi:heme oxygenase (biliverdin-producing, ferredoxin)
MQELASRLRKETYNAHRSVERSPFMSALLLGQLERSAYVLFLRNLEPIYEALELGLMRHANKPFISLILKQPLLRLSSLHRDLEFFQGSSWRCDLPIVGACSAYVNHLCTLQDKMPQLLIAHAYVRYLGDLSGGQMLQKIVVRSLQLPDTDKGIDFYNFGDPYQVAALLSEFRTGLNLIEEVGTGTGEKIDLVSEARFAFELHIQLFDDLAHICGILPAAA